MAYLFFFNGNLTINCIRHILVENICVEIFLFELPTVTFLFFIAAILDFYILFFPKVPSLKRCATCYPKF